MATLPVGDYGEVDIGFRDASGEIGRCKFYAAPLTAGNFAAQQTAYQAVLTAMGTLSNGILADHEYGNKTVGSPLSPETGARELYLKVHFWDSTNYAKMTTNVPVINESQVTYIPNAGDNVSLTEPAAVTDFIDAFEAFAKNPLQPTHGVQVYKLTISGKNI